MNDLYALSVISKNTDKGKFVEQAYHLIGDIIDLDDKNIDEVEEIDIDELLQKCNKK